MGEWLEVKGGLLGSARGQGGLCAGSLVLRGFSPVPASRRTGPSEAKAPGSPSRAGLLALRVRRTRLVGPVSRERRPGMCGERGWAHSALPGWALKVMSLSRGEG